MKRRLLLLLWVSTFALGSPIPLRQAQASNDFLIFGRANTLIPPASTRYSALMGPEDGDYQSTEAAAVVVFPASGTLSHLRVRTNQNVGAAGENLYVTLRLCNPECADTLLACQVNGGPGTDTDCDNGTDVTVRAGDRAALKFVTTTTLGTPDLAAGWTFEVTSDTSNESWLLGRARDLLPTSNTYAPPGGHSLIMRLDNRTEDVETPIPDAITLTDLYVWLETDLIGAETLTITVEDCDLVGNCSGTSLACTVDSNSGDNCSAAAESVPVNAGHTLRVASLGSGSASAIDIAWGIAYTHPSGHFAFNSCNAFPVDGERWSLIAGANVPSNFIDTNGYRIRSGAFTLRSIGGHLGDAGPGAGTGWDFHLSNDGVDRGPSCSISGSDTTCTTTGLSEEIALDSNINWHQTQTGSPALTDGYCLTGMGSVPPDDCGGDSDGDGIGDDCDNCPHAANPGQEDTGGIGAISTPDGIGDECQCGDVSGDGRVTSADSAITLRSLLNPPTATMNHPERCNVGGSPACSGADSAIMLRAQLAPPTATVQQVCAPALAPL